MASQEAPKSPKAIVVTVDKEGGETLAAALSQRGVVAEVEFNPAHALKKAGEQAPALAVVGTPPGIPFLRELLKVSWMTNMILVSDMEAEALHDQAEGLGILGAMKTWDDYEGLETLLERFFELRARNG